MLPDLVRTVIRHRELIWNFVRRDFKGRYLGSYLGFLWNLVQPVMMVTVYTFIFAVLMGQRNAALGADTPGGGSQGFAIYIFTAMVPWVAFAEAIGRNTNSMLESANLIKKVAFPSEIVPLYQVVYAMIGQLFSFAVLFVAAILLIGYTPSPRLGLLLILLPLQAMFALGLGYFLAALNVFIRDTAQFMNSFMVLWMLTTPIFYSIEMAMGKVPSWVFYGNPQFYLVQMYRWMFPPVNCGDCADGVWRYLGIYAVIAVVALCLGHAFFMRCKGRFADEV